MSDEQQAPLKFFVQVHDPAGEQFRSYEGMTQETVASLVEQIGHPYDFIDEEEFSAGVAAGQTGSRP